MYYFIVVHTGVELFAAVSLAIHEANGKPVCITVTVKGHRVHDGQLELNITGVALRFGFHQVVGKDAHRTGGRAAGLDECSHFAGFRSQVEGQGDTATPSFDVQPEDRNNY